MLTDVSIAEGAGTGEAGGWAGEVGGGDVKHRSQFLPDQGFFLNFLRGHNSENTFQGYGETLQTSCLFSQRFKEDWHNGPRCCS